MDESMLSVEYETKLKVDIDVSGRPTITVLLAQKSDIWRTDRIDDLLVDTGANVTTLNKRVADQKGFKIIRNNALTVWGFNDISRAYKALMALGKTEDEARLYLGSFSGKSNQLSEALRKDFNITDIGLLCDLRSIPYVILSDYIIKDVIIATPSEDGIEFNEVIGMNILEKFNFGFDLDKGLMYISKKQKESTHVNPDFACGNVRFLGADIHSKLMLSAGKNAGQTPTVDMLNSLSDLPMLSDFFGSATEY